MNTSELSLVPLKQASLCLDCEMITASQAHCFACGSVALMSLSRALNGKSSYSKPATRNVVLMNGSSPSHSKPLPFKHSHPRQRQQFRNKYADIRRVLLSALVRPVRDVFAIRYGS
jgi:hypothetical protein